MSPATASAMAAGAPASDAGQVATRSLPRTRRRRRRWRARLLLAALIAPTLVAVGALDWYPKLDAVRRAFCDWDGGEIARFVGVDNFVEALTRDPVLPRTFALIGVLLIANLAKMWPSIGAAIVLHRLRSARWQYAYRVLFVVPLVIPGLVWLLVWKQFFDPSVGLLNALLNATGGMQLLAALDHRLPALASGLAPALALLDRACGGPVGLAALGVLAWAGGDRARRFAAIASAAALLVACADGAWSALRAPLLAAVVIAARRAVGEERRDRAALAVAALGVALVLLGRLWTVRTGAFDTGQPAWLGSARLVVPAIILWGFPWVGSIGVLIYLGGLQAIGTEVYEAAAIDGAGAWRLARDIELPMILAQVRVNLVFMTIGTLTDYGLFLLLLGPGGGPGNAGLTPGLYLFDQAFSGGRYGYACALGLLLAVAVLALSALARRYLAVER